jgi:hypothetical protein
MPMSPNQGPTSGGTSVTITGVNLAGATAVHFGANPGAITSNTPTQVTVVNPAGSGVVCTTVTTTGGTSNPLPFYYIQPPFIVSITGISGPVAGGNTVTLTGTNLSTATSVDFGGNAATPTIVNDGTISVTVPAAAAAGTVPVTLTTAGGTADGITYTYVDAPTIASISPTSGPTSGGTTVSVTGTGLTTTTSVTVGGTVASFAVVSDTLLTLQTPPGTVGPADVVVTTTGGSATAVGAFTYTSGPAI